MIRGVIYDREDTCPECRRQRSLELYDKNDRPAWFTLILDRNEIDKLYSRQLYYFKCKQCGKEFRIDWGQDNRIPIPLLGNKLESFLNDYCGSYELIS